MCNHNFNMPWKWTLECTDKERDPYYDNISRAACLYITEKDTIYINSGTTGNMMVKYLPNVKFTLITNSILIANAAYKLCSLADIIVIGGRLRIRGVCDDENTFQQLASYKYDVCFLTGQGFSYKDGLTNTSYRTSRLHNILLYKTKKKILLLPYFKIGQKGEFKSANADQIDILITNKILTSRKDLHHLNMIPSLSIKYV